MTASVFRVAGGALVVGLAAFLGACKSPKESATYRDGVDTGYVLGSADAAKRLYWAKQALEAPAAGENRDGRVQYYEWTDPPVAGDPRHLAPAVESVPIYTPYPPP